MEIFKIVGIGLLTCVAALLLKQLKPEISIIVALCGGLIILSMVVDYLAEVLQIFKLIVDKTGLDASLFTSILKIIGIGYITEWTANICNDTGLSSLSDKILLAGKIIIFVFSLPIITNIIEIITGLLGLVN